MWVHDNHIRCLFICGVFNANKSSYTPSNYSLITVQGIEKSVKEEVVAQFEVISRQFGSRS
jgi:hypothetical protein